jgi:PIN domain nuclease of toxin-antitoxin system
VKVKILFDSHALVWFTLGDKRFPARLRDTLDDPDTEFVISAVCIWEIVTKVHRGKWPDAEPFIVRLDVMLQESAYVPLSITIEHARVAGLFAWSHRDPFDRLLAAQSQIEGVPLITADPVFRAFGTSVLW